MQKIAVTTLSLVAMLALPSIGYSQSSTAGKSGLPLPRFVSLKAAKVNVRVGPGTDFKVNWLYQKRGLPMEIIQEFDTWRKVRDPEGNEGWVLHSLLSGKRTVVIRPWETENKDNLADMRARPENSSGLSAKLQPGVVGDVKSCSSDWCEIIVKNDDDKTLDGYVEKNSLWGVYPDEIIED